MIWILFYEALCFYGIKLYQRNSLVIFDEVQMCSQARQLVKHLVADGWYDMLVYMALCL